MWAYYAEGQQGACVRFPTALLYGPDWDGCFPPMPVTYAADFPVVPFYRASEFERGLALLASKSEAWRHEGEWRIARNAGVGAVHIDSSALDAVILGCKMQQTDRDAVQAILDRSSRQVRRLSARPDEHAYRSMLE
jgi:hypothetical protein